MWRAVLAKVLGGRVEMVDLEDPETPMVACGEGGSVLLRIAHTNIATDKSYVCEHWVLIDIQQMSQNGLKL